MRIEKEFFTMTDKQYYFGSIFLLANRLQNLGDKLGGDLPLRQWHLLMMLNLMEQDLPTMTEVAHFVGGTRQNITRMLQALEKKSYVNLRTLPEDKISTRVTITEKGKEYLKQVNPMGNLMLEQLFSGIDAQSIAVALDVIKKLFENIESWDNV